MIEGFIACMVAAAVLFAPAWTDKPKDDPAPPAYTAPVPGPGVCPKPGETPCAPGVWEYGGAP